MTGRHSREDDGLDAIMTGWNAGLAATAPRPRQPADAGGCPRCTSVRTVSHGAQAHCGSCGHEWQLQPGEVAGPAAADRARARRALDSWTEQ